MFRIPAVTLAVLVAQGLIASAAGAHSFTVSTTGNRPSIAVDPAGTTHVAWDSVANGTSTTHYCRVPRKASKCAAGSERTFTPIDGAKDFAGPRIFVSGNTVAIVTTRCCTDGQGPDGQFHDQRVLRFTSADGGNTFDAGTWVGTQQPDIGAAFAADGSFLALGIAANGTALQADPVAGFSGTPNTLTPTLALSGGVGTSPNATLVAINDKAAVFAGVVSGDPNAAGAVKLGRVAAGGDTRVDSGPKGPDVLYKTPGRRARYVVRRLAKGKLGRAIAVSEPGFPIFGSIGQDPRGRIYVVWEGDRGLTLRSSSPSGHFGHTRVLSHKAGFFNTVVAADAKGHATVAYDSNGDSGKVGGFTAG